MSYELKKLIEELENSTTLSSKKVIAMFIEELKENNGNEERAIHNVKMRVKYMM